MRRGILFISSALDPENTYMESAHSWVFVVKSGGVRRISFVLKNLYLVMLMADTLKASHDSTKREFMCQGKNFSVLYFSIHTDFTSLERDFSLEFGPLSLG